MHFGRARAVLNRNKAEGDLRATDKGLAQAGTRLAPEQRDAIARSAAALRAAGAGADVTALQAAIAAHAAATNPLATIIMNEVVRKRLGGTDEGELDPDKL